MSVNEAAFMGRMTARMTHEMRNILAIMKESTGLITDILTLDGDGSQLHKDKLERALHRIREQIPRGVELLDHFNRLAHSMDEPRARLDIGEFLEHMAAITRCFTRLKMVDLRTDANEESLCVETDPFRLHWILFSCIEHVMKFVPEGGVIVLGAVRGEKGPHILLRSEDFELDSCRLKPSLPGELAHLERPLEIVKADLYESLEPGPGYLLLKFTNQK